MTYTEEELLESLKSLADELGHSPKMKEMNAAEDYPSATTYQNYFDSWDAAKEAAGLETVKHSKRELLESLESLTAELGHPPTVEEMNAAEDCPSVSSYIRQYESWNAAKKAAGLDLYQEEKEEEEEEGLTDEELLRYLKSLIIELGRGPTPLEMDNAEGYPDTSEYIDRFGTFSKAKQAAKQYQLFPVDNDSDKE